MDGFPDMTQAKLTASLGGNAPGADTWPEPVDFLADNDVTGAPELKSDHIPAAIAPFVFDAAARMGVDPATVALSAIVSLASVMSDEWRIQPKQYDTTWTENPRIWGAIVGDPSVLKSPVIAAVTKPIERLEIEGRENYEEDLKRYKIGHAQWKKQEKEREKSKSDDEPEEEPRHPRCDRYMVENATVEALSEVLRTDGESKINAPAGKVLVRQDEMSEWVANFDRYKAGGSGGGDRGAYLRLYNGGRFTVDRVGRGSFSVPNWSGCLLGGIQPEPIQRIARESAEDGLIQRIQFAVPGQQGSGEDRQPDREAVKRYGDLFSALTSMKPAKNALGFFETIVLHADAHQDRKDILALAEALSAMPDTSGRLKAAFGKWPGLWARLTLIFHLIELADARAQGRSENVGVVGKGVAATSTKYLREILLPHLLRADAIMFSTVRTGHARWIAGYILSKSLERITVRDLVQDYRPLRAPEQRRELLEIMESLELMGWVRPEMKSDGRPPAAWRINPAVFATFCDRAAQERAERQAVKERIRETLAREQSRRG